jgi:hypothetical protein
VVANSCYLHQNEIDIYAYMDLDMDNMDVDENVDDVDVDLDVEMDKPVDVDIAVDTDLCCYYIVINVINQQIPNSVHRIPWNSMRLFFS